MQLADGGEQFGRRQGCGAQLAYDYARGNVGEDDAFGQRDAGGYGERKHRQHGVACAGDVEDLPACRSAVDAGQADARVVDLKTCGWNVDAVRRTFLEQTQAVFSKSDNDGGASEMREQGAAGFFDRRVIVKLAGDEKSRFLFITNDGAGSAIGKQARGFWLYESGDALAAAFIEDALGEGVGDDSFVVIGDYQRMEAREAGLDSANQGLFDGGRERVAVLAIDAHHLLMARDDARLERSGALGIGDHAFGRHAQPCEAAAKIARGFIGSGDAERRDAGTERREIRGHVAGSAQARSFRDEIDHGHGGFRRKAVGAAPDVAVEHQIADDADAPATQAGGEFFEIARGDGF